MGRSMIEIRLQQSTAAEHRTRTSLIMLLDRCDLAPWAFTRELVIDEQDRPHSHPVLTLDAAYHNDHDLLLATYLHEQLHWFEETHAEQRDAALTDVVAAYPQVPSARPDGAGTEDSTRLHLLVCHLEHRALAALMGSVPAERLVGRLSQDHYRWIYRRVLTDRETLAGIVARHGLLPSPLRP